MSAKVTIDSCPLADAWLRRLYDRVGYLCWSFPKWRALVKKAGHAPADLFGWEAVARTVEAYVESHPDCDKRVVFIDVTALSLATVGQLSERQAELLPMLEEASRAIRAKHELLSLQFADEGEFVANLREYLGLNCG